MFRALDFHWSGCPSKTGRTKERGNRTAVAQISSLGTHTVFRRVQEDSREDASPAHRQKVEPGKNPLGRVVEFF